MKKTDTLLNEEQFTFIPNRESLGLIIQEGTEKYSGEWGRKQVKHLLSRATFGYNFETLKEFENLDLDSAVEKILNFDDIITPPINHVNPDDPFAAIGETWIESPYAPNLFGPRINSFFSWWFGNIYNSGSNVGEKMLLFWHNHFVTESLVVRDERFSYKYYMTLRRNALGNFKKFTEEIIIDPAMLRYLNGNENIKNRPNENFARELFELFTVGKGPQIGPGNYTNFTEDDVIEASKVLTGWRALRDANDSRFFAQLHDTGSKKFSSAFGNEIITNSGEEEYKILVNMIFKQDETAKHICRKIYRWFVYYEIDETTEAKVIEPLATTLKESNYEIKPVLRELFKSAHFYNEHNISCLVKNPIEHIVNLYRSTYLDLNVGPVNSYFAWTNLGFNIGEIQEMILSSPPSVAGWPALYQAPGYHRLWFTSVSAPTRAMISDVLSLQSLRIRQAEFRINPLEIADKTSNPIDPNQLIKDLAEYYFQIEITEKQLSYLKDNLLPGGLEDYNWAIVWGAYKTNPDNEQNTATVEALLRSLHRAIFSLAEYQLG